VREPGGPERDDLLQPGGRPPSSLRAIVELLRSLPERLKRPESLLMLLAIFASIGVHMPPYLGLGVLADYFESKERARELAKPPPISFDVVSEELPKTEPPQPEPLEPPPEPEPKRAERDKPKPKPEPQKAAPKEEPKPVVKVVPSPAEPPPPEPPKEERKQSITQKSVDPNVEPPPDAKFLAEESQRVEEESVASVTSETKNDPNPQASAPQAEGPEESGDSSEDERGAEKGSKQERPQQSASRQQTAQPALPRPAPSPPPQASEPARAGRATPTPAPRAEAPKEQVFHDPLGSFVLAPATPTPRREGARTPSGTGSSTRQPSVKVSWRAFEQTFGAEQLAQDRLPREAKRRGAGREKRWDEFRAAIENYVVGVKPGNTTALNAAADPFAAYLAAFHRNLHMEFAHDFLSSLPMAGELGNPALVTKVEIVVNADGSLDRVGVVKSSGNLMYDFGAFNAVQRGGPYPPTPEKIRSPDGRVYLRWALHRNESQCGTWNAEPYILKTPPRSPNDPKRDNVSPFRPGSDTEQGRAPRDEPRDGKPSKQPAVLPGETLGRVHPKRADVRAAV
jgi:TonB family protein